MIFLLVTLAFYLSATATLASMGYLAIAAWNLARFPRPLAPTGGLRQAVTILKPLCGIDFGAYENLRSFCRQDYSALQIIFGVKDADDPVIEIVRRLIREFPEKDIALVIADQIVGANLKVSNLANMYGVAKHDLLIIADSDIRVGPNYVSQVAASFADPAVGVVTCLYKAKSAGGLISTLASMSINEWFLPSALTAIALQGPRFCFGSTMAARRKVVDGIGGFAKLATYIADDHMLGLLTMQLGYKIHLSSYVVENVVHEPSLSSLFAHELRWARTIRSIQPRGHAFSFTMYGLTLAIITAALAMPVIGINPAVLGILAVAFALRCVIHYIARTRLKLSESSVPWLIPIRDLLSFAIWATSVFGSRVVWKGWTMSIGSKGQLTAKGLPNL